MPLSCLLSYLNYSNDASGFTGLLQISIFHESQYPKIVHDENIL